MRVRLLCILLGLTALLGCQHRASETVLEEASELPSQEGWDSKLIITQNGRKQAVVHYGHMQKFNSRRISYFDEGVEVDFFNRYGDHTSHLTSNAGEYHENTEDVIGIGNVVVVSDSGTTLHTERLRWDQRREKILSDTVVMVTTTAQDTLYGIGFESEPDLSQWIIQQPWGVSDRRIAVEKIDDHFRRTRADTAAADTVMTAETVGDTMETAAKAEAEANVKEDSTGVERRGVPDPKKSDVEAMKRELIEKRKKESSGKRDRAVRR